MLVGGKFELSKKPNSQAKSKNKVKKHLTFLCQFYFHRPTFVTSQNFGSLKAIL